MPFPGVLKVFDSHSRDVFGRPSALGYCVMTSIGGIESLGDYFQLTILTSSNVVIPFEIKGVKCINSDDMETVLSARVGVVGPNEVFEQYDVNSKTLSIRNFNQTSKRMIISNISTEQSGSTAKSREYRNRKNTRRHNESTEQREIRLVKMRQYSHSKTQNETTEQREARLAKVRKCNNSKIQNESTEQREARIIKVRKCNNSKRQNETTEQREARLAKELERKRASRKRASSQKQGEGKGNYISHPVGERTSSPVSNYFPNENNDELALVRKFHDSVSVGPLYICTCCDQLWFMV